jgi:endoglucanase
MVKKGLQKVTTGILILGAVVSLYAKTPVHGWLKTEGAYILNEKGNIVQLKGMSFFWSSPGWYSGSSIGSFYTADMVNFLADQWKCTVLRVAYSTDGGDYQGWNYCETVIKAAIDKGIYVIIDWHSHTAHQQENDAIKFFTEQATKYKDVPNVIFEIFNEPKWAGSATPNDGSVVNAKITWSAIKPYMERVTKAIRNTGSKNLVIVGTPYFCQHVGVAAGSPITDNGKPFENVAYSFHFYAASHGTEALYVKKENKGGGEEASYLVTDKVPIFVTEWGTSHSDGGLEYKEIDAANTKWWFDNYVNRYHWGSCNWSVSNWQSSSAFSSGTNPSASGQIVKNLLNYTVDEFVPEWKTGLEGPAKSTVFNMPATHPAVKYNSYYGTHADSITVEYGDRDKVDPRKDIVGITALEITPSTEENWVVYKINSTAATKNIVLRCLATDGQGKIEIHLDSKLVKEISIAKDANWVSIITPLDVPVGKHDLKFRFVNTTGTSYSIAWFELINDPVDVKSSFNHNSLNKNARISQVKNGFEVMLPKSHEFTQFTLIEADGRIFKSGTINKEKSQIQFNGLSNGLWLLKLESTGNTQIYKTVVK